MSGHDEATLRGTVADEAVAFARILAELDGSDFDWLYYLEKPYKWDREYQAWLEHGRPLMGEEGWPEFTRAAEEARRR